MSRFKSLFLFALVLVSVVGAVAAPAAAATMSEVENSTVTVGDDTTAVWGQANASNATTVNITLYGIDNGTETQLKHVSHSANASETVYSEYQFTDADLSNYSEARVVIEANEVNISSTDYGTILSVSGGGGGSGSSSLSGTTLGYPTTHVVIGVLFVLVVGFVLNEGE